MRAHWNDNAGSKRQTAIAGEGEKFKDLRATYASENDALEAAKSELRRIQRGTAEFELTMAHGRADITPETPINLRGWKPQIDGTGWRVTEVTDSLDDSGYGTRIRCEVISK